MFSFYPLVDSDVYQQVNEDCVETFLCTGHLSSSTIYFVCENCAPINVKLNTSRMHQRETLKIVTTYLILAENKNTNTNIHTKLQLCY